MGRDLVLAHESFGYATLIAPSLLFYELPERRSLDAAVKQLPTYDAEPAMWRHYTRADMS